MEYVSLLMAYRWILCEDKGEGDVFAAYKDRKRNSCTWNSNVAKIVYQIIFVGTLAIMRLVIQIERRGHAEEMHPCMLFEQGLLFGIRDISTEVRKCRCTAS